MRKHLPTSTGDKDQGGHACRHAQANRINRAVQSLHDVIERQARLDLAARAIDEHPDRGLSIFLLQVQKATDKHGTRAGIHGTAKLDLAVSKHLIAKVETLNAFAGLAQNLWLILENRGCIAHVELPSANRRIVI